MAQQSFRFNPQWTPSGWWRLDISWRTDNADDHHFIDEWTGSIPEEASTRYTWYTIPKIKITGKNEADLIEVDRCTIKISQCAEIEALCNPANVSAEARLWWSADQVAWQPIFWGLVDLDDPNIETEAIVGGVYINQYQLNCYDGLLSLNSLGFDEQTYPLVVVPETIMGVTNGAHQMEYVKAMFEDGQLHNILPRSSNYYQVAPVVSYMDYCAKRCFPERVAQTVVVESVLFGYDPLNPTECQFTFMAWDNLLGGSWKEMSFDELYLFYDMFAVGTEWAKEWASWGEFLAELCETFGMCITTAHTLESGKWVRSLRVLNLASGNGRQIVYAGVTLSRKGPRYNRKRRRVTVTTQTFSGGAKVKDVVVGVGTEKKLTTHFRTLGYTRADDDNYGVRGSARTNTLWNCLIGKDNTEWRIINCVKYNGFQYPSYYDIFGTPYPYLEMWYDASNERAEWANGTGLSMAMGELYLSAMRHGTYRIEETRSGILCTDGVVTHPGLWSPYVTTSDDELSAQTFLVLDVEIDPMENKVTITKEGC